MRARTAAAGVSVLVFVALAFARCAPTDTPSSPRVDAREVRGEPVWSAPRTRFARPLTMAGAVSDGGLGHGGECRSIRVLTPDESPASGAVLLLQVWSSEIEPDLPPNARVEARASVEGIAEICAPSGWATLDAWDHGGLWGRHIMQWRAGERADVHLMDAPSLRGRVVDERGAPIASAEVFVQRFYPWSVRDARPRRDPWATFRMTGHPSARTDRDGRFELPLGRLAIFHASAHAEGYLPAVTGAVAARPGADLEIDLVLPDGVLLCGTVYGEGSPLSGAVVGASGWDSDRTAETDDRGRFCLRGTDRVAPSVLWAQAAGWLIGHVYLPSDERRIALERAALLRYRARLPANALLCGEHASLQYSISGADHSSSMGGAQLGSWIEIDAHPGEASVSMNALGHTATRSVSLRAGETTELDVVLEVPADGAVLSLRLRDPDLRQSAVAQITSEDGLRASRTRADARPSCIGLEPGRYTIELLEPLRGHAEVDLAPGRITELVIDASLHADVPAPPLHRCWPPLQVEPVNGQLWVTLTHPSESSLLPGDRITRVEEHDTPEAMHRALRGAEGSTVRVHAVRPDGSAVEHLLTRVRCL